MKVYAVCTLNTVTDAEFHNGDGFSLAWKHTGGAVGSLQGSYASFPTIGLQITNLPGAIS